MRFLTVQERFLVFAVLLILVVGACVRHFRQLSHHDHETIPDLSGSLTLETSPSNLPSMHDVDEDE